MSSVTCGGRPAPGLLDGHLHAAADTDEMRPAEPSAHPHTLPDEDFQHVFKDAATRPPWA
ncbi:hypothetical protein AB0H37_31635 [Actinomadura sp. NPDC023710]|uniref:hypothetical protein n=1 Tax=Actinomadura sp. NPDC023710 TaxID=3158219 RepID=UPI0033E40E4D